MTFENQKLERWIKKHRLFAWALPIVIILGIFFITTNFQSKQEGEKNSTESGYNNTLPNQKNELEVKQPNALYKQSVKDSLERLRDKGSIRNIVAAKKENDSLERILEELNNFSLDEESNKSHILEEVPNTRQAPPEYVSKKTAAQEKLEYRKLLLEARDERLSRSQDYSAPYTETSNEFSSSSISFDAAIYRDQFILPGDRVTLILNEEVYFKGNRFPKNTFIYATSHIQGSRVLLEISNINNHPLLLVAKDQQDGMLGLHNERANELLQEFKAELEYQGVNGLSDAVGEFTDTSLSKNLVRSFGNFFSKKKYKQKDKILLVNGDQVFLVSK